MIAKGTLIAVRKTAKGYINIILTDNKQVLEIYASQPIGIEGKQVEVKVRVKGFISRVE